MVRHYFLTCKADFNISLLQKSNVYELKKEFEKPTDE